MTTNDSIIQLVVLTKFSGLLGIVFNFDIV